MLKSKTYNKNLNFLYKDKILVPYIYIYIGNTYEYP